MLTPEALRLRRVDWPELVHESMTVYAEQSAQGFSAVVGEVTGSDGSLTATLDAIDAGALWQIADRLPKSDEARAATGRAAREFARPRLRAGLLQLTGGEFVRQGRARWQLSWTDSATLKLPEGYEETLPAALDAAVADVPDTEPLRKLLAP